MRTTSEPLARIALDCGLCDQSHLTRQFRRLVGMTPRAWRREQARLAPAPDSLHRASRAPLIGGGDRGAPSQS